MLYAGIQTDDKQLKKFTDNLLKVKFIAKQNSLQKTKMIV